MTEKVQNAIMNAQSIAIREQHQEVDEVHLFLSFLEEDGNLVHSILEKTNVNVEEIRNESTKNPNEETPVFQGVGWSRASCILRMNYNKLLAEAEKFMKQFNDEYLSVEHILLAAVSLPSEAGKYLKTKGIRST